MFLKLTLWGYGLQSPLNGTLLRGQLVCTLTTQGPAHIGSVSAGDMRNVLEKETYL